MARLRRVFDYKFRHSIDIWLLLVSLNTDFLHGFQKGFGRIHGFMPSRGLMMRRLAY